MPEQYVEYSDIFQLYRRQAAKRYINNTLSEASCELFEKTAGRACRHIHNVLSLGIVESRQKQHLRFAADEPVVAVLPDIEHAARRRGEHESAVFTPGYSGAHDVAGGKRCIKRHIRLL